MQSAGASSGDNVVENTNVFPSTQGQFPTYENPIYGIKIQYPADATIDEGQEQTDDDSSRIFSVEFNIAEGTHVDVHVDNLDPPGNSLVEYAGSQIEHLREAREGFRLIESTPITPISNNNDTPGHKVVYTSISNNDGSHNITMRIWMIKENKLYTIAYVADEDKYATYLPVAQKMIDSFEIVGAEQIGSGDRNLNLPELKPETTGDGEAPAISEPETPPITGDFVMKVRLEPHENEFARQEGRYQVSDFAIVISNSSKLCPVSNCLFDLDGEMTGEDTPAERALDGKLRIETGDSTKIMDLYANLQTVEERHQGGENVQVIQGELITSLGDVNRPNYQSLINGTLVSDGDDFTLELVGTGESPFIYT